MVSSSERADEHASSPSAVEKERQGKKLDQSLSGERFNEDDLIRSAAELYGRLSGFSRQSLVASQVARIVGNCFRNPAQMRSRSRHRRVTVNVRVCRVCSRERDDGGGRAGAPRRAAPILMCESLGTITAITGPVASQHILSAYAATSPFPTPYSIHASRKSCEGSSPYVQRICG